MIPKLEKLKHTNSGNFFLIAGPCIIEDKLTSYKIAEELVNISDKYQIPLIFKASYKKANRSSINSFMGLGDLEALSIIQSIGSDFSIPTLTDIHSAEEASIAAKYVDILQIPAFLCRQTELLVAAAKTGKTVNIKKGQFSSPESMKFAVEKITYTANDKVMITERGTQFGYQDLVVDFRGIPIMQENNCPVILDITHSLQQPNQISGITGGKPEMISTIAKAGIASGIDGIFLETHPIPANAKSDGANMIQLSKVDQLIKELLRIHKALRDCNEIT
jgi:2-dehydro-3-deoxyphosphooctonate aldolase (KDO 8-P synthase)